MLVWCRSLCGWWAMSEWVPQVGDIVERIGPEYELRQDVNGWWEMVGPVGDKYPRRYALHGPTMIALNFRLVRREDRDA